MLTVVNHLNTSTFHDYWSGDADVITINTIEINKDDLTPIGGQFDSGADTTVTNLLMYLHLYKYYTTKFKYPVKFTVAVGTKVIYPINEGFLHLPDPTPSRFLAVYCVYSPHIAPTLASPYDILMMSKDYRNEFNGQDMKTYFGANSDPNYGQCSLTCHHDFL